MSDLLPLFPLPKVVLFPNVFLPLHIFERRYREMVADAIKADRLIGMVLLRPGWDRDYEGSPPVYPIGSSGVITHVETLPDGRYNIVLRGLERFRILEEDHSRSYRVGVVEPWLEQALRVEDRAIIRVCRSKLQSMLSTATERSPHASVKAAHSALLGGASESDPKIPAAMPDEDLINALAQYLDLEPIEKQALLETPSLRSRAESLVELLEMKIMTARTPGVSQVAH
ncbi:MAG TPA: LON peptidase substrate-binding domain-containing protein [Vicinamibacterales bacterium]|jgi:Lon protease-like protein|nr:LON peptidase substrate-binding domain-containing protein [Vicinamibacterales bacterium]